VALCAALLVAAPAASGKTHRWTWKVQASPISVKLDFYGDQAAGCADIGVCKTYGTAAYLAPKSYGVLNGSSPSASGRGLRAYGLAVNLEQPAKLAVSVNTRGADEPCTDEASGVLTLFGVNRRRDFVFGSIPAGAFPGFGPHAPFADFLASRCAGPTSGDVRTGLAVQRLPEGFVNLKKITIDLRRTASFSGGGFSGTVTTTGRLTLRK
jgi:hypothetical protein